jgi:folate-binding protein YgfZ
MSFPDKKQTSMNFETRHTSLGGTIADFQESPAVSSYGDPQEEAKAAVSSLAVLEFPAPDVLEVHGKHAERFLHGLVTSDIKGMGLGTSAWSTALNRKGRLVSDFTVWRLDEKSYRLVIPAGRGKSVGEHLIQHKVAERVEIEWSEKDYGQLLIFGPEVTNLLGETQGLSEWVCAGTTITHGPGPDVQLPCRSLLVEHAEIESVWDEVVAAGARPMGTRAFDALRVESGFPIFGVEALEDRMPIEVGMDATVSFLKGCYVGQEVIAMATYRGHPNRKLMGVRFANEQTAPDAGQHLQFESGKTGFLTTTAISPRLDVAAGLAVVHYTVAVEGTKTWIETQEGRIEGQLVELPLIKKKA